MITEAHFGQWLKQRRKALDLTQRDLAQRIGCALVTIQKIEEGERRPSKQIAELLAEALQIPTEERAEFLQVARRPIAQQSQATESPLPPLPPSLRRCPTNLPAPLTPLIGRERELAAVLALLTRADVRLVTLVGPPGVGKTRLSIAAGQALAEPNLATGTPNDLFCDGIWFIPLAAVREPGLVMSTIAHTLGVVEGGAASIDQALQKNLRHKHLLLVLDNFEQILDAAPAVAELLVACPGVRALVSSRAPLFIRGEHEVLLDPFELPDPAQPLAPPAELRQHPALALFEARVQSFQPTFGITPENARTVIEICARLDGLPLAIELAAARLRQFSLTALADHLCRPRSGALNLLAGGARDLPARHQTLRGAVAWSYDLLEAAAQHLFQAISVFVGGFDYRAMAAVAGTGGRRGGVEHGHLLAALQELVDHRLVQQSEDSEGTRYGQLETIRDYGVELLAASGEQAHVQRRHAEYFLSLVQSAPQQAPGEVHHRWLERLAREQDNLRTALRWLIAHEPAAALQLANGLADFWHRRGYHREGRQWLAQTLALNPTPTTTRAAALLALGRLAHEQGESAAAQRHLDESLQIAQTLGDSLGVARALQQYGWVAYDLHDVTRALAYFAESLALFRRHGERLETAHVLYAQAHVLSQQGVGAEEIEPLLAESLAIYRELDHAPGVAHVLHNQGIRANLSGEYGLAVTLLREALAIHRQVSARRDVGWTLHALGEAEWLQRNLPAARRYLAEGFELFDEIGDKWGQALALHHLAQVDQAEGQLALAQERYQTSLTLFQELKNRHMIARCLAGLGGVALAQGEPERAAYLLAGAQTILDDLPPFLAPGDRQAYAALIEQTKAQLGEAAFAAAWQGGATAPVDQLIHWALARTRRT